ncbi:hypothetical protein OCL88_19955, partial [Paenarthrobacter sp. PAE-2]|nr:hypothetical protein [Paenarthrobacter sp. PAE-2]
MDSAQESRKREATRSLLDHQRTVNRNALTALLRSIDLGIDARSSLRDAQITTIAAWRTSNSADPVIRIARVEAKRLALAVCQWPLVSAHGRPVNRPAG